MEKINGFQIISILIMLRFMVKKMKIIILNLQKKKEKKRKRNGTKNIEINCKDQKLID